MGCIYPIFIVKVGSGVEMYWTRVAITMCSMH